MPVKRQIVSEAELIDVEAQIASKPGKDHHHKNGIPKILEVADLLALLVPKSTMLIQSLLTSRGASLVIGSPKSGKTLFAVQAAIAVASGTALFDYYSILEPGPALVVEQDDPAGAESVKTILERSRVAVKGIPFALAPRLPFAFGPELIEWLEGQISSRRLRLVVLDSYTALRSSRSTGIDIVKAEQLDLTSLDDLGKRTNCALLVIHHASKGSAGMDWSDQAAGTFAMSAATEAQIHISRFKDLDMNAPERLVRVRGRHQSDVELLLRFRTESLDYEHVLEGGAAPLYPLIVQIQAGFGTQTFGPKELAHSTGVSRATAGRQIERLHRVNALTKRGYGEYLVSLEVK